MFTKPWISIDLLAKIKYRDKRYSQIVKSECAFSIPVPLKCYVAAILSSLINHSFLSGTFPSTLKYAKFTPVFKKGSKLDKDNYRLRISILSIFSKLFENSRLCNV